LGGVGGVGVGALGKVEKVADKVTDVVQRVPPIKSGAANGPTAG